MPKKSTCMNHPLRFEIWCRRAFQNTMQPHTAKYWSNTTWWTTCKYSKILRKYCVHQTPCTSAELTLQWCQNRETTITFDLAVGHNRKKRTDRCTRTPEYGFSHVQLAAGKRHQPCQMQELPNSGVRLISHGPNENIWCHTQA